MLESPVESPGFTPTSRKVPSGPRLLSPHVDLTPRFVRRGEWAELAGIPLTQPRWLGVSGFTSCILSRTGDDAQPHAGLHVSRQVTFLPCPLRWQGRVLSPERGLAAMQTRGSRMNACNIPIFYVETAKPPALPNGVPWVQESQTSLHTESPVHDLVCLVIFQLHGRGEKVLRVP